MKLKLSTLIVIIGLIFAGYYYFIHNPCQPPSIIHEKTPFQTQVLPPPPPQTNGVTVIDSSADVTPLPEENFSVTPITNDYEEYENPNIYDPNQMYQLAGNVRPDNVMQVEEGVTLL